MSVEDDLRLAWQADLDGRVGRRDALLTLAAAGALPETPWLARCRDRLVRSRPDHLFSRFPTVSAALADPRVVGALAKIRAIYPPGKVRHLVFRDAVRRGPWTGRRPSMAVILADLFPTLPPRRVLGRAALHSARHDVPESPPTPAPSPLPARAAAGSALRFYLEVLMAVAVLMALVVQADAPGRDEGSQAA